MTRDRAIDTTKNVLAVLLFVLLLPLVLLFAGIAGSRGFDWLTLPRRRR